MKRYHTALTIAGSDSGGGAGIQADLKTMTSLGVYGLSVITSVTAQNTQGVQGIHPVPVSFIETQLQSVFDDIEINAIKIGMLHSREVAERVGTFLQKHPGIPVVLDPVMVATSGDILLQQDAIDAIRRQVFPVTELITPNIHEARVLTGQDLHTEASIRDAGRQLHHMGARNVLIKGGDIESTQAQDILYLGTEDRHIVLNSPKIETRNLHGTGCSLSSAIAAYLSQGQPLEAAVRNAKEYIQQAIQSGAAFQLGRGHGPIHHMWDQSHS